MFTAKKTNPEANNGSPRTAIAQAGQELSMNMATIQRLNSAVRPKNPSPAATAVRSANRKALRTRAPFPAPKL